MTLRCAVLRDWVTDNNNFFWVQVQLMSSVTVWLFLLIIVFFALLPDLLIRIVHDIRNHRSVYRPVRLGNVSQKKGLFAVGLCMIV